MDYRASHPSQDARRDSYRDRGSDRPSGGGGGGGGRQARRNSRDRGGDKQYSRNTSGNNNRPRSRSRDRHHHDHPRDRDRDRPRSRSRDRERRRDDRGRDYPSPDGQPRYYGSAAAKMDYAANSYQQQQQQQQPQYYAREPEQQQPHHYSSYGHQPQQDFHQQPSLAAAAPSNDALMRLFSSAGYAGQQAQSHQSPPYGPVTTTPYYPASTSAPVAPPPEPHQQARIPTYYGPSDSYAPSSRQSSRRPSWDAANPPLDYVPPQGVKPAFTSSTGGFFNGQPSQQHDGGPVVIAGLPSPNSPIYDSVSPPRSAEQPRSLLPPRRPQQTPEQQSTSLLSFIRNHDPESRTPLPNLVASMLDPSVLSFLADHLDLVSAKAREVLVLGCVMSAGKWRARVESGDAEGAEGFQRGAVELLDAISSDPPLPSLFPGAAPRRFTSISIAATLAQLFRPLVMVTDPSYPSTFPESLLSGSWLPEGSLESLIPLFVAPSAEPATAVTEIPWSLPSTHPINLDSRARWTHYGLSQHDLEPSSSSSFSSAKEPPKDAELKVSTSLFVKKRSIPIPSPVTAASSGGGDKPPKKNPDGPAHGNEGVKKLKSSRDLKKTGLRGGMDSAETEVAGKEEEGKMAGTEDVEMQVADEEPEPKKHGHAHSEPEQEPKSAEQSAHHQTNGTSEPTPISAQHTESPAVTDPDQPEGPDSPDTTDAGNNSGTEEGEGTDADVDRDKERAAGESKGPGGSMLRNAKDSGAKVVELSMEDLNGVVETSVEGRSIKPKRKASKAAGDGEEKPSKGKRAKREETPSSVTSGRKGAEERRQKAEARKKMAEETEMQRVEREELRKQAKREADRKRREEKRVKDIEERKTRERDRDVDDCMKAMLDAVVYSVEIDALRKKHNGQVTTVLDVEREREASERRRQEEKEKRRIQRMKQKEKQMQEAAAYAQAQAKSPQAVKRKAEGHGLLPPKKIKMEGAFPMPPTGTFHYPYPPPPPYGMYPPHMFPGPPPGMGGPGMPPGMPPPPHGSMPPPGVLPPPGMPPPGLPPPVFPPGAPPGMQLPPGMMMPPMFPRPPPVMPMPMPPQQPGAGPEDPLDSLPFLKDPTVRLSEEDRTLMRDFLRGKFSGQNKVRTVTLASFLIPEPDCDPPRSRWIKETVEFEMTFATGMWRRSRKKRRGITLEQAMSMGLEMRDEEPQASSQAAAPAPVAAPFAAPATATATATAQEPDHA